MPMLAPEPVAVDMRFVTPDIKRGDYYIMRAPITGGVKWVYPRMMGEKEYAVWWQGGRDKPTPDQLEKKAAAALRKFQKKLEAEKRKKAMAEQCSCLSQQQKMLFEKVSSLVAPSVSVSCMSHQGMVEPCVSEHQEATKKLFWGALAFLGVTYLFFK